MRKRGRGEAGLQALRLGEGHKLGCFRSKYFFSQVRKLRCREGEGPGHTDGGAKGASIHCVPHLM